MRRSAQAVVVVLGASTVMFVMLHLLPGNEARAVLGLRAYPAEIKAFNRANGLDKPLMVQYGYFIRHHPGLAGSGHLICRTGPTDTTAVTRPCPRPASLRTGLRGSWAR
ncbi:MAG: hypothetical protein ACYDH5_02420 [Acidimicrobiales bacterium]